MELKSKELRLEGARYVNVKKLDAGGTIYQGFALRVFSATVCVLLVLVSFGGLSSAFPIATHLGEPEMPPTWTSPNLEDDIHVIEIARGSQSRPYYSIAGSRNEMSLFSEASNIPLWTREFDLGGLMIDDTSYGEMVEWNSLDISVDPVRVVAGARSSEVRMYDVDGNPVWSPLKYCGSGQVRAVAITPSADLVVAGSDYGPKVDDDWSRFHYGLQNTGSSPFDTSANNGAVRWKYDADSGIQSSAAISPQGTIYFTSSGGVFHAINPDGSIRWAYDGDFAGTSPAIAPDGTIYVGTFTSKLLLAFNPDGSVKWSSPLDGRVWRSSPAVDSNGVIYIVDESYHLYAIYPDGSRKWKSSEVVGLYSPSPALSADGSTIYVPDGTSTFKAINANDGSLKWKFINGFGWSEPSAAVGSDGTIYIGFPDKLYAINPDGTEKWNFEAEDAIESTPAVSYDSLGDTIYVGSEDENLYAINADGSEKWHFETGGNVKSSPAIGSDGTIFVGSLDGKVRAINPDGTLKWYHQTSQGVLASPAIGSDGTVYIGSNDGYFYAFNKEKDPPKPYLCGLDAAGNIIFEGYVIPEDGYIITDIDISESGRYIVVSLAGDHAVTVLFQHYDRQYTGNEIKLELPNVDGEVKAGEEYEYRFTIFNEGGVLQKVQLTRDSPPLGWTAKFNIDGEPPTHRHDAAAVTLSVGESASGTFFVGAPLWALPPEKAVIKIYANSVGDPHEPPGYAEVETTTEVVTMGLRNELPIATIDGITPLSPVVGAPVVFLGHGQDSYGTIISYRWASSLNGIFCEGYSCDTVATDSLQVGHHGIYFSVQDDMGDWSLPVKRDMIVISVSAYFPSSTIRYDNNDLTASIAEISRDGRLLAIGSLYWGTIGDKKTSVLTYYTDSDWENPGDTTKRWEYTFDEDANEELEVTAMSLSEFGYFVFVGTYYDKIAEVFVFYRDLVLGTYSAKYDIGDGITEKRIWSSDFDGIAWLYPFEECGDLILGTSAGGDSHTVYNFMWSGDKLLGLGFLHLSWVSSVGSEVAAVCYATGAYDWKWGAIFVGDRLGATDHVYYYEIQLPD